MVNLENEMERKVEEIRNSGLYPVVNLNIFDAVRDLTLSDYTLEHESDVLEAYNNYLDIIESLPKTKKRSLSTCH